MHNAAYFEEGSCILLQWRVIAGRGLLRAMLRCNEFLDALASLGSMLESQSVRDVFEI